MDRNAHHCIRTSLKITNMITGIAGIAMLLYSVWMTVVCLRDYHKYHLPWFLWACIGAGTIFCFTACVGHATAKSRNCCCFCCYIMLLLLLLVVESLIIADVCLNDHWKKDFPKDPTDRFHDFVDFVEDNDDVFKFLTFLVLFCQVTSMILSMAVRKVGPGTRSERDHHDLDHHQDSTRTPFLDYHHHQHHHIPIQTTLPYVFGHPHPHLAPEQSNNNNNAYNASSLVVEKDSVPYSERNLSLMAATGCPPYCC